MWFKNKTLLIICIFVFCCTTTFASQISLSDIQNHWAKENIILLVESSAISGYSDGTFKPENNIKVAEFLKILIEAGDYTLVRKGSNIYPDFYLATAVENNLIVEAEVSDSAYWNKDLTRHEMVNIISNFVGVDDVKVNKNIFKDLPTDASFKDSKNKILKLVKLGIINGYEDDTFRGENNVTRAEAVTIICRSLNAKEKLISKRKYDVSKRIDLSNYLPSDSSKVNSNQSSLKTFYEISNNKIKIYDSGRYANLDGYEISNEIINIKNVIKVIENLVNEKAYVAVTYSPFKYTINEFKIMYGSDEIKALSNEYDFAFNYYENKTYALASKSIHSGFSNNCYLRIDVLKLWDDFEDYKNGSYIDKFKKEKLESALKAEFGSYADEVLNYMIDKNIKYVTNIERDKEHAEQKVFGKFIVNFYQKEYGIPQFYIERN